MTHIKIKISKAAATAEKDGIITTGMVGVPVSFMFDSWWDGLIVTAVFKGSGAPISVPLLGATDTVVPWEVLKRPSTLLRIGAEGRLPDGTLVIPTTWATVGIVMSGANATDDLAKPPTPTAFDRIMSQIGNMNDLTTEAKDTLVAAINEAARTGGGAGSMELRVADGYVQYSADGGMTWTNLIAMADLKGDTGEPGKDGHSPVVTATKSGKTTTISVDGAAIATVEDGADGKPGTAGADGITPTIGANGNWYLGDTDTGKPSRGEEGPQGPAGTDGKTAYQYAVEVGYTGTEAEFAAKLAQEKFANPNALTFTGAVTGTYDGSEPLTVEIPSGGGGEWETVIDTTLAESAELDTGEMPGKTEMLCVFSVPKSDSDKILTATSKAFGKKLSGFAMVSASYGKIGVIYAKKICGHAIAYVGSGDTTRTNPDLDTTPRSNISVVYYRITSSPTDIPLKLTSALPAGTIIKVFVR